MIWLVIVTLAWLCVCLEQAKDNPVLQAAFFAVAVGGTARLLLG
jgi:hypothetical protein